MPIYEYQCDSCGHELEKLQRMSDDPLRDCPDCGEPSLRKLLSAPNFRLKGGGWYETDFKDKNQRNLAGDGAKTEAGKSDSDKSDKKGGAKSGSKSESMAVMSSRARSGAYRADTRSRLFSSAMRSACARLSS